MRGTRMIPRRVGRPQQFAVTRSIFWWERFEQDLLTHPPLRQRRDIGRLLARRRLRLGLTQRQLAERARTSASAISRLERARAGVTLATLQRIAEALGLELLVGFRDRTEDSYLAPGLTGSARTPEKAADLIDARRRRERADRNA